MVETSVSETGMRRFESFLRSQYGDVSSTAEYLTVTQGAPGQHRYIPPRLIRLIRMKDKKLQIEVYHKIQHTHNS